MNSRPRSILVVQWSALAILVVFVVVPIGTLLIGQALPSEAAEFLTMIAVVFALSGATLIGGLLAFGLSVAGVLLEWWHAREEGRSMRSVARSPSALLLLALVALVLTFFL